MDTISTGIGGALLAKALPEHERGPRGVWAVTLASLLPDADVFADFLLDDPLADLTQHRGFTHSLLGLGVMAPLVAWLLWRFSKDKNYRQLLALVTLGLLWHLFTDLATSWGTMVFHPFSRQRVVWDLLFIIDFAFTGILLLPQLAAWIYRRPNGAARRAGLAWALLVSFTALVLAWASPFFGRPFDAALLLLLSSVLAGLLFAPALRGWGFRQSRTTFCRLGLAALGVYLGVCTTAHFVGLEQVKQFSRARALAVEAQAALPQPLSPFRWSGLVLTPEGVYQSWFHVLEADAPEFEFFPTARNEFVARAERLPAVKTYLWFARFPLVRYRKTGGLHLVEYTDLRFQVPRNRSSPFVFRITFNAQGKVLAYGFRAP